MIESSDPDEKKDREIFFNDIPTSEVNKKNIPISLFLSINNPQMLGLLLVLPPKYPKMSWWIPIKNGHNWRYTHPTISPVVSSPWLQRSASPPSQALHRDPPPPGLQSKGSWMGEFHGCWMSFPYENSVFNGSDNIIGLVYGEIYRKPWFLPSNIGFSCKFSHHPILW